MQRCMCTCILLHVQLQASYHYPPPLPSSSRVPYLVNHSGGTPHPRDTSPFYRHGCAYNQLARSNESSSPSWSNCLETSAFRSMAFFTLLALVSSIATAAYVYLFIGRREKHLPPGPPTLPILGNIHQIPKKGAHFQFTEWAKQYGGIYSLKLGTGTAAVITDGKIVKQLIDKKSALYSQRPKSYVADLISSGDHILLMQHGQQWRSTRKILHGSLMERVVDDQHLPIQEAEARQMIRDYLLKPEDHMLHPKRFSNSVTMSIVWGVRTPTPQTEHMQR
jgi:hypothetical protein